MTCTTPGRARTRCKMEYRWLLPGNLQMPGFRWSSKSVCEVCGWRPQWRSQKRYQTRYQCWWSQAQLLVCKPQHHFSMELFLGWIQLHSAGLPVWCWSFCKPFLALFHSTVVFHLNPWPTGSAQSTQNASIISNRRLCLQFSEKKKYCVNVCM